MEKRFILNGRFLVSPTVNLISDQQAGTMHRLEPRLMQVLCILTEAAGRTVSREELVEKVWQNYGGGDEGLTQAVSALRKVLKDTDKKMIQTVSKKGYLYNGVFSVASQQLCKPRSLKKNITLTVGAIASVLLLIFSFLTITPRQTPLAASELADTKLMVSSNVTSQNPLNSVICYDNYQNSYKWVSNGDAQPEFYINNLLVPIGKWESHMNIITYLKHRLQEKRHRK